MPVLIVTYDLGSPGKDYTSLYEAIKNNSSRWSRYITDAWFVSTDKTPKEYFELLYPHIDKKKDFLFVSELKGSYYGFLPEGAWKWFEDQDFEKQL